MTANRSAPESTHYIFDLDGTIADTFRDLLEALNHAVGRMGGRPLTMEEARRFIGRGAANLVDRSCEAAGCRGGAGRAALGLFRAAYQARCTVHTQAYPGVRETIAALGPERAAVLTNKPRAMSLKILRDLGILPHVKVVVGGDSLPVHKPDPSTLRFVARLWGVPLTECVMVGDSVVDVEVARRAGIPCVAVDWSSTIAEELRAAGADRIISHPRELLGAPLAA